MLRVLNKKEKEDLQKIGYMCEHLLCFYSMVSDRTALYNEDFPVFLNCYDEADAVLFGLLDSKEDRFKCVKNLVKLPIKTLNVVSPVPINEILDIKTKRVDWDFHLDLNEFDFSLRGNKYKNIRNRLRQAEKMGFQSKLTRKFTPNHRYILSRHMARYKLGVWDYEELLSLERFFIEHNHGLMIEAYKEGRLVGFDVVDFFENKGIMVVPLGIYLQVPLVSDFLMYENLKFARDKGYTHIDLGVTCGRAGLRHFKEKWFAKPKFKLYIQTLKVKSKSIDDK